ncbi:MAG: hypothetical protein U9R25_07200 [Chloroflexota bacterium]|nr:hypothetical protein [Chloroflexota bacterium]
MTATFWPLNSFTVYNEDVSYVKINEAVKNRTKKRIRDYAETHLAGSYTRLDMRFRGQFCYVDAYTEPEPPGPNWPPPDWAESREEYLQRLRNTPVHLFRLRYFGDEEKWELAFYSYAHGKYELSVFPTGEFYGKPEVALQTAADFHL